MNKMNDKFILSRKKNKIFFGKAKLNIYHIIIFIICSIIILSNSEIDQNDLDESKYSYITLKIGEGNNKVYSNSYTNPKIIYINENNQSTVKQTYQFTEPENSVILIWEKPIQNCQYMFQLCNEIYEFCDN